MYQKGALALLIKKELVGGPWNTGNKQLVMEDLSFPVEIVDVTYLGDEYQEIAFVVKHLTSHNGELGRKTEIVYPFNLTKLT
jgi:hypothetical protein